MAGIYRGTDSDKRTSDQAEGQSDTSESSCKGYADTD